MKHYFIQSFIDCAITFLFLAMLGKIYNILIMIFFVVAWGFTLFVKDKIFK